MSARLRAFGDRRRLLVVAALVALLVQAAVVMVSVSRGDVPTFDEPDHFAAAIEWTQFGDLAWSPDAPPLSGLMAGLPFRFMQIHIPKPGAAAAALDAQNRGVNILYRSGNNGQRLIEVARLPMIGFTLLVIFVAFGFGRSLWGTGGGLVAAAVASFDPNLIANGHLVSTDVPIAGFALAAGWLLYLSCCAEGRRSWWLLLGGSACVGCALASKFTALPLLPGFMALAALPALRSGPWSQRLLGAAGRAGALTLTGFAVVWLCYLAVDPSLHYTMPKTTYWHAPGIFSAITRALPLPLPYRVGLLGQIQNDLMLRPAFLLGERYRGGRLLFYPALLALKTPLGTLGLMAFAVLVQLRRRSRATLTKLAFLIGLPLIALDFAMTSSTNIGFRHILIVPLFGAVLCGGAVVGPFRPVRVLASVALIGFLAVSSLSAYPSYLAYINEAFGSGAQGYRQLSDSSIDWGQDLARLAPVLRKLPHREPVWLAYFGTAPPSAYGIRARVPDPKHLDRLRGGVLAISVSVNNTWAPGRYDGLLAGLHPFAQVGHSILLYRIPRRP